MKKIGSFIKKILPYLLLLVPLFLVSNLIDNDFWFTINHGRYILQHGFTNIEPFTIHEGFSFSFEKWLTSVLFYQIWINFGVYGVYMMKLVITAIIEIFVLANISYISKNKAVNIFATTIVMILLNSGYITTRPQSLSYIFLLAEFWFTEHYAKTNNWKYLIALPFISLAYMQFHSTMWPMFFVMLLPYICDFKFISKWFGIEHTNYKKSTLISATFLSVIAGLINPYGLDSVTYLFKSLGVTNGAISELVKPNALDMTWYAGAIFIPMIIYVYLKYKYNKDKNRLSLEQVKDKVELNDMPLRYIYFIVGTLLMALFALRNIAYFIIYGGIILSFMFEKLPSFNMKKVGLVGVIVLIGAGFISTGNKTNPYLGTAGKQALDELRQITACSYDECGDVKIFTGFNTGSYAEWLGFKTYIDPRAEVFLKDVNKKEDVFNEYLALHAGAINYNEIQEKYNFKYWLIGSGTVTNTYMSHDVNYKPIITTDDYIIYKYIGGISNVKEVKTEK